MKEKYLSEGFNEYLAKPIEKDELIRVMNILLQKDNSESINTNTFKLDESSEKEENIIQVEETQESNENNQQKENKFIEKEKFLRKKGIDLDKALELLGDMEMYEATLKDFYDTADTKWLKIMSSKNTKDLENYAIEVHSLKSDAKYLGFMELANVAYEHELKSKEKDEVFVSNHFNDLEYEYNKVMSIIDEYNSLNQDRFTVMDLPH